ncbi:right-handed parallel beta-helix repeat-containing protein [Pontibacter mangrovi]|nr:right-handed parallel beta-helix repeat-containing protein [Pontibacter mangrovi]
MACVTAKAETYYVSSTGHASYAGTSPAQAWASIEQVNARAFAPGDTILFEGETIFPGNIYFAPEVHGTPERPIVLGSFGAGRAVIRSGDSFGFYAYNNAGIKIMNLVFEGSGRQTNQKSGIEFYLTVPSTTLPYIAIDNVEVYGFGASGIRIGSWTMTSASGYSQVSITNSSFHDNGDAGITTYADNGKLGHKNVYVAYNKVYNNAGIPTKTDLHSGNGIILGGVDGGTIEYCEAYNNGWLNAWKSGGPVGIWCYMSNNVIIQYNESHHNKTGTTKDGGGFDIDGGSTNCVLQYNYSHDNEGAGYLLAQYDTAPVMKNLTVRYNISENDGRKNGYGAVHLWSSGSNGGIQNAQIYNNTIYLSPAATGAPKAVWVQQGKTTVATFRNNIFMTTGGVRLLQVDVTTNVKFEGNNYWASGASPQFVWGGTVHGSLDKWRASTTQESRNGEALGYYLDPKLKAPGKGITVSNPKFLYTLEGYKLDKASPLAGKALRLRADFGIDAGNNDFWGNSLKQRSSFSIGANERTDLSKACLYGGPQLLTFGQAAQGTYSGNGVTTEGYFDPEVAGAGTHPLVYIYTDSLGQEQAMHHTVYVTDTKDTEWTGQNGTTDWFDSQNWSACVPTSRINATIPVAEDSTRYYPSINAGQHGFVHNLDAQGPLTIAQDGTLEITGSLAGANLNTASLSRLIFNSESRQYIPAGIYSNLVLQGAGTKKLAGAVTVTKQLDLSQSKLLLGNQHLTLASGASIAHYGATNYIVTDSAGFLTQQGLAPGITKVYPVGTARGYAPVMLRNDGTLDNFGVRVEDKSLTEAELTDGESTINKTWHIEEEVKGGSDVTMTLQWSGQDEPDSFNRSESYIRHFEGEAWQMMESDTITQGAIPDTYQISLSGVSSFSPFTVASTRPAPTPLPITLAGFTATRQDTDVLLQWQTSMEKDNLGFEIELSPDGKHFRSIGFIPSKSPNSLTKQIYSYRDTEAGKFGTRYYRLRQLDLDGTATLSAVKAVTFREARLAVSAFPNPFDDKISLVLEADKDGTASVTLTDARGNTVLQTTLPVYKGISRHQLDLSRLQRANMYFLSVSIGKQSFRLKLLKK